MCYKLVVLVILYQNWLVMQPLADDLLQTEPDRTRTRNHLSEVRGSGTMERNERTYDLLGLKPKKKR